MPSCQISTPEIPLYSQPHADSSQPQTTANDVEIDTILFVGGESLTLTNLLMTNAHCQVRKDQHFQRHYSISLAQVYSYDPKTKTARLESVRSNRLLMRRYAVVQRARDADVFGILVGTLGVGTVTPSPCPYAITHFKTHSIISTSDIEATIAPGATSQEELYYHCGEVEPCKIGKFSRD